MDKNLKFFKEVLEKEDQKIGEIIKDPFFSVIPKEERFSFRFSLSPISISTALKDKSRDLESVRRFLQRVVNKENEERIMPVLISFMAGEEALSYQANGSFVVLLKSGGEKPVFEVGLPKEGIIVHKVDEAKSVRESKLTYKELDYEIVESAFKKVLTSFKMVFRRI